jgi:predicted RNase H-like HicB family nuclease
MHPNYTIIIQYDPRDNIFVVTVPELEGCMTHGGTYEEAIQQAHDAIETWLIGETPETAPTPTFYPQPVSVHI